MELHFDDGGNAIDEFFRADPSNVRNGSMLSKKDLDRIAVPLARTGLG